MIVYRLDATWVRVGRVGGINNKKRKKKLSGRNAPQSVQDGQNERELVRCT